MDKESRKAFMVVGAVLVGLLAIGLIFSGGSGDAVIGEAPVVEHGEADAEHGEAAVADNAAEAPAAEEAGEAPMEEAASEVPTEVTGLVPGDAAETEDVAETDGATTEEAGTAEEAGADDATDEPVAEIQDVALAGDPEAGERLFRQCQACHMIGEGAENRVGPQLTGIVGRQIASVEGFAYSDSLSAAGQEGRQWTPDELRGFLANPREYVPGTAMAYAGVRSEDDLEDMIAYLATFQ